MAVLTSQTYASGTPAQKLEFWETKLAEAGEAAEYTLRGKELKRQKIESIQKQIDRLLQRYPELSSGTGSRTVHAVHGRRDGSSL